MRRAFREDRDWLVARHGGAQVIDLIADACAVFTADEDCVVDLAQPPNQRPAFDSVIGDKGAAGNAGHDGNVYPAMVICGVEHIRADTLASGGGRDPACPTDRQQEKARPRRRLSKQPPDIMEEKRRSQARGH